MVRQFPPAPSDKGPTVRGREGMQRSRSTAAPILTIPRALHFIAELCAISNYITAPSLSPCFIQSFCFLKQHRIFCNSRVGRRKTRELKTISGPPIDRTRLTHNITSEVKGGRGEGVRDELRGERKEYVKYLRELDLLRLLANAFARKVDTNSSNYTRSLDVYSIQQKC